MATANCRTVGDSCGDCGSNLHEILDGPMKNHLFCLNCLYKLPEDQFEVEMAAQLEYQEE